MFLLFHSKCNNTISLSRNDPTFCKKETSSFAISDQYMHLPLPLLLLLVIHTIFFWLLLRSQLSSVLAGIKALPSSTHTHSPSLCYLSWQDLKERGWRIYVGEEILILKYINAVCEIDLVMYPLKLHFVFQSQSILCNSYFTYYVNSCGHQKSHCPRKLRH